MLVSINEIFNRFEKDTYKSIDQKSQVILDECHDLIAPLLKFHFWGNLPSNILIGIKNQFIYESDYCDYFFQLLNKQHYNKNSEIKDIIGELSSPCINVSPDNIILKYINSPYIDAVEKHSQGFKIKSEQLGNFSFELANRYFWQSIDIVQYINNSQLKNKCHSHVAFLTSQIPKLYSVTSFVENMYEGCSLYHSYCLDKDRNKVIDLNYNMVMDKDEYDQLFKCEEIFQIKGEQLSQAAHIAITHNPDLLTKYSPMIVTLFQQYIWENNLATPDCSIFSEDTHNPKLLIKNRFGSNN